MGIYIYIYKCFFLAFVCYICVKALSFANDIAFGFVLVDFQHPTYIFTCMEIHVCIHGNIYIYITHVNVFMAVIY